MEILIKIKNYPKSALLRVYEKGFSSFSRKIISMMPGFSPQVILMMDGGLGSQMMKYAVGREVERISGLPVSFDLSWFDKSSRDCNGIYNRTYRIDRIFPKINVKKATTRDIILYKLHFRYPFPPEGIEWEYNEVMMSSRQARYLGGYYINAQYVDKQGDRLRDEFSFGLCLSKENKKILSQINSVDQPIALHVRRGDYLGLGYQGLRFDVTTPVYFLNAIKYMSARLSKQASFSFFPTTFLGVKIFLVVLKRISFMLRTMMKYRASLICI